MICDAVTYLAGLLKGTDTRLLVVGGAGSLFVDPEHSTIIRQSLETKAFSRLSIAVLLPIYYF